MTGLYFRMALALWRDPRVLDTINVRFVDHTLKIKSNVEVGSYTRISELKDRIKEKLRCVADDSDLGKHILYL